VSLGLLKTSEKMNKLTWFKEKSKYLNFDAIEKELKIPQSTLYKWTSGKRNLPKKWEPVLIKWIDQFLLN
jgi:hypothetical protein